MSSTPCKITFLPCYFYSHIHFKKIFLGHAGDNLVNKLAPQLLLPVIESNAPAYIAHSYIYIIHHFLWLAQLHVAQHKIPRRPTHAPLFLTFSSVSSRTLHFSCAATPNRLTKRRQSLYYQRKTSDVDLYRLHSMVTCFNRPSAYAPRTVYVELSGAARAEQLHPLKPSSVECGEIWLCISLARDQTINSIPTLGILTSSTKK